MSIPIDASSLQPWISAFGGSLISCDMVQYVLLYQNVSLNIRIT